MVSDKTIHKAFRTHKTLFYKQNPLDTFLYFFYYLQKLHYGFMEHHVLTHSLHFNDYKSVIKRFLKKVLK